MLSCDISPFAWKTPASKCVFFFSPLAGGLADSGRGDADHGQQDHPHSGGGGTMAFRDEKQETMVVRPYPQVQTHGQLQAISQTMPIQSGTPMTVPAPSVHLPQGQPAVLTEGQMKVMVMTITVFVHILIVIYILSFNVFRVR